MLSRVSESDDVLAGIWQTVGVDWGDFGLV